MKKVVILLTAIFLLFSCSSDDGGGSSSSSDLTGTWSLVSKTKNSEVYELDDCELMNTLTFTSSMVTDVDFFSIGIEGECEEDSDTVEYTTNRGAILVMIDGEAFSSEYSIDGSILTITNIEVDGPDDELFTFVEVYRKE